jgi:hypothetical protein
MVEGRSALKILTGKLTGKRPSGRPRQRWEDYFRIIIILRITNPIPHTDTYFFKILLNKVKL